MMCAAEWRPTRSAAGSDSLRSSRATFSWRGWERPTMRSEEDAGPEYMASSEASRADSFSLTATGVSGRMRATTTAAARRGEMLFAMSKGVVPAGTSRTEPSGSWILIGLLTLQG